jgi:glucose/mannose-6-phosphate isomerase
MNLDDYSSFTEIDSENLITEIDGLPDQLEFAWELGSRLSIPAWSGIRRVLVAGMGGSAIAADLLGAYAAPRAKVPLIVHRNYGLPAWVSGEDTLFIASSHSGNTEETLSAFEQAVERGCRRLAITTGGKLAEAAGESDTLLWKFEHEGQPRAAVGFSFGLLLAVFARLGLIDDSSDDLKQAVAAMREQQKILRVDVPASSNPAKRMAGQLVDRWVAIMGADVLAPVARRWKGQVSEVAKAWGQFEYLPEADHNTLAGIENPQDVLSKTTVIFLRAPSAHPRNQQRVELTKKTFMLEGISTDFIDAKGETALGHLWTCLHFGDYTAYYLAMAYGVDPTPVEAIENFKKEMG